VKTVQEERECSIDVQWINTVPRDQRKQEAIGVTVKTIGCLSDGGKAVHDGHPLE